MPVHERFCAESSDPTLVDMELEGIATLGVQEPSAAPEPPKETKLPEQRVRVCDANLKVPHGSQR